VSSPAVELQNCRSLPSGILVGDVADLSRHALVSFLHVNARGGERADLVSWLFGPYLDALTIGRRSELEEAEPSLSMDEAVTDAAHAVERVLLAFHQDPDLSVATRLIERGIVEPIADERGGHGYAPAGAADMPLTLRVLSLAAAELLTRPERVFADLAVSATSIEITDRVVASGVGLRARHTLPWTAARDERASDPGWPARGPSLADLVAAAEDPGSDRDSS
jgi:hypothetical protein